MSEKSEVEIWAPIPGYHGYEASSLGRIRSYWVVAREVGCTGRGGGVSSIRDKPRILPPAISSRGYLVNRLTYATGKSRNCQVHRLVLMAFRGECPLGKEGCHIDGTRTNARLDNLYWGTRRENTLDTSRHGRNPQAGVGIMLTDEQIAEVRRLYEVERMTQMKIAAKFNCSQPTISEIIRKARRFASR